MIETREHAERRGASIMARVAGSAMRFEPAAVEKQADRRRDSPAPSGRHWRRPTSRPDDIGHVNAHGNSTREDDPIEARAIRETLGDVPVTAPKSYFGNLGQGSGMVELVGERAGSRQGVVPPTLNYETPDPECPVKRTCSDRSASTPRSGRS